MRKALGLSSLALSMSLIAAPAAAFQNVVELAPPTDIISNGQVLPDAEDLFTPLADLYEPLLPPAPADDRSGSADQDGGPNCKVVGSGERKFVEKINRARARNGRKPVHIDVHISAVSGAHSRAMKRESELRHTGEKRLRSRVTRWELLGENVGRGGSVDSLHRAFMASPGHRRTVLEKQFRYAGIGIAQDSGQMWVTVLLESHIDPGTTMKLPEGC